MNIGMKISLTMTIFTQIFVCADVQTSEKTADHLLSRIKKEVDQDIIIEGVTIKKGMSDCQGRYSIIKSLLDNYKRPFTLLDIGASEGYFSLRIAREYKDASTCVMIEGNKALLLPDICYLNKSLSNIILLEKCIRPGHLKNLGECEHFDVILAFNVINRMKNRWKRAIDYLLTLGDYIFIEVPISKRPTAANKKKIKLIQGYLTQKKHGSIVAKIPYYRRHGLRDSDQEHSIIYLFNMQKSILLKALWASPDTHSYSIKSNFEEKKFYKARSNTITDWKRGINLWTFKCLHGVYPAKNQIHQEIKRLSVFPHSDFLPWNIVIQGDTLELIDWDDRYSPTYMHNAQACIAQFEV